MQAKIAVWILLSSVSLSFGRRFPRKSAMNLSTLGGEHASTLGLGYSLNRASLSSLERHLRKYLAKYFFILGGAWKVPSLGLMREEGLKHGNPIFFALLAGGPSGSESSLDELTELSVPAVNAAV